MKISFVIPVRNEQGVISAALASLQWLRRAGHEIIVVDGGSEDQTWDIALPMVDRLVDSAAGRAWQMNRGAAQADGDVLVFLHIDTVFTEAALHALQKASVGADFVWGRFDVRLSGNHGLFRLIEFMMNLRSRITGIATGDQAIFVTNSVFKQIGGFPELPLMEDIAMSRRLKKVRRPVCIASRITTSSRRWERHGIVKTILLMWKLRCLYWLGADAGRLARQYYR